VRVTGVAKLIRQGEKTPARSILLNEQHLIRLRWTKENQGEGGMWQASPENASKRPEMRANNKECNKLSRFYSQNFEFIPFETKSLSSHIIPQKSHLCNTTPLDVRIAYTYVNFINTVFHKVNLGCLGLPFISG